MFFYCDKQVIEYEKHFKWDCVLSYLEQLYSECNKNDILNALIGYSWYYLIEGPVISGKYAEDDNVNALDVWKKYIDIGIHAAKDDPSFLFIAGYTLSLHGFLIGAEYEQTGSHLLRECLALSKCTMTCELARSIINNENASHYLLPGNGKEICLNLFGCESMLSEYFTEIFAA